MKDLEIDLDHHILEHVERVVAAEDTISILVDAHDSFKILKIWLSTISRTLGEDYNFSQGKIECVHLVSFLYGRDRSQCNVSPAQH